MSPESGTRSTGRIILGSGFDAVLLMRPRQWPILTAQLAVGVLAAPACHEGLAGGEISSGHPVLSSLMVLISTWLVWVVCLNGGTLAFNSAYDRDINDIAYLRSPPQPPSWLAAFAVGIMFAGAVGAWLLAPVCGLVTALCVLMSVLYSHPAVRWKAVPGADLAINMVGYGGGTTLVGLLAGQLACGGKSAQQILLLPPSWLLVGGFAFLFGSFYPLTQIYQLAEDNQRGDRTLASALGVRPSLMLAQLLGWSATACFVIYFVICRPTPVSEPIPIPLAIMIVIPALLAWQTHTFLWWRKARTMTSRKHEQGMYRALGVWACVDVAILVGLYTDLLLAG